MGPRPRPLIERLLSRVEIDDNGCWIWLGNINRGGYGLISLGGRRMGSTHRASYIELVGPIPDGMHIDHLCRNKACCNPEHLEPVTPAENIRRMYAAVGHPESRKTHCPKGHPYDFANTRYKATGKGSMSRGCIACHNEAQARYARRRKERAA